ncbi:MAG TPA: ATP synthase F1 subunit delta [Cyclobacteriaceae bacterium]|nr:ATP synthase F1 subunit delta [Cyclobacteriaceae bacterium]
MASRVASRYVKSLLDLAVSQKSLDKVHDDMKLFSSTIEKSRELELMLKSPVIKHDKKNAILSAVFKSKVSALTMAFIDILTKKNREPLLPEIAAEFHNAYNTYKGIGKASVTTTVPMDAKTRADFEAIVKKLSNSKEVELQEKVDKDLIGGFILNVEDRQIDASIRNNLKKLKLKFSENPYIKEF